MYGFSTFPHQSVRKCGHSAKPGVRPWKARHVTAAPLGPLARDVHHMAAARSAARSRRSRGRRALNIRAASIHRSFPSHLCTTANSGDDNVSNQQSATTALRVNCSTAQFQLFELENYDNFSNGKILTPSPIMSIEEDGNKFNRAETL